MDVLTLLWEVVVISTHKALERVCKHTHKHIHKYPTVSDEQGSDSDWTVSTWFTRTFSSESHICATVLISMIFLMNLFSMFTK